MISHLVFEESLMATSYRRLCTCININTSNVRLLPCSHEVWHDMKCSLGFDPNEPIETTGPRLRSTETCA